MKHAKFVSFTLCGAQTVQKAVKLLPDFRCERYARTVDASLSGTSLKRFAQQAMVDCALIVFVGATGIAVRAAAPYLMGKAYDPAVIVIDEQGKFVIPLLSGHLGGANKIAEILAQGLQAVPVLTTATDGRQVFAVDTWAKAHSCAVLEPHYIKYVSGALHRGETVGVRSDFPIEGLLPARIDLKKDAESGNYNPVALRYGLKDGAWDPESRHAFAVTLDHSIHQMAAAFELWNFGVWTTVLQTTFYAGLFRVGHAVLEGTYHRRDRKNIREIEETT